MTLHVDIFKRESLNGVFAPNATGSPKIVTWSERNPAELTLGFGAQLNNDGACASYVSANIKNAFKQPNGIRTEVGCTLHGSIVR